jgi:hypothetical protein
MSPALPAERLAMRLIAACATAAWIGMIACIATRSGKGVLGADLPPWVTVATMLLGFGSMLLTLMICFLLAFDQRKTCTPKETAIIIYGFSFAGSFWLVLLAR